MVESIPLSAWQDAVYVCLFIVMIIVVLGWQSRQQKQWQDFSDDQNTKWQNGIADLDARWQRWLEKQNVRDRESMKSITEAIERLSVKMDAHDQKVESRISGAVSAVKGDKHADKE